MQTQKLKVALRQTIRVASLSGDQDLLSTSLAALCDLTEESGEDTTRIKSGDWQATNEGELVVTVGRYGSATANTGKFSYAIWTTKIYRAERRKRDGVLTWRLHAMLRSHATAGREITGPMIARARAEAEDRGCGYVSGCLQNEVCD